MGFFPEKRLFAFALIDDFGDSVATCDVCGETIAPNHYEVDRNGIPSDGLVSKAFGFAEKYFAAFVGNVEIIPG